MDIVKSVARAARCTRRLILLTFWDGFGTIWFTLVELVPFYILWAAFRRKSADLGGILRRRSQEPCVAESPEIQLLSDVYIVALPVNRISVCLLMPAGKTDTKWPRSGG
jgi:hypothetical protein